MIIDVCCEDDTIQIARINHEHTIANIVAVNFLNHITGDVYDFSNEVTSIPTEAISGFYDVERLEDTGLYIKVPGGYELIDDSEDEDYTCSEDDEDSESESLVDEDDEA